jgi:hypothetical protein
MAEVADHIARTCDGKLDAIVVSHRHSDHLSGFKDETWETIKGLEPKLVLLPWTEDPKAATDARAPTRTSAGPGANALHVASLHAMRTVVESARKEVLRHGNKQVLAELDLAAGEEDDSAASTGAVVPFNKALTRSWRSSGDEPANLEQVMNLMTLPGSSAPSASPPARGAPARREGPRARPADARDCPEIARMRAKDADEFWQLAARASARAVADGGRPFPKSAPSLGRHRWRRAGPRKLDALRGESCSSGCASATTR